MNFQQLEYFKLVAEEGNLTRAAKRLMIAPPSLSASIVRLEKEMGCQFFDRSVREMKLNKNGIIFLKHVNNVLASLELAKREIEGEMLKSGSTVTIAAVETWVMYQPLNDFLNQHPNYRVSSHALSFMEGRQALTTMKERFDFVIAAPDYLPQDEWESEILLRENPPYLVTHPAHRLAKRERVSLAETKHEKFISVSKEHGFRNYFDKLFLLEGFDPDVVMECEFSMRKSLILAQHGITITTKWVSMLDSFEGAVKIPISDPILHYPYAIYWRKDHPLSPAANAFFTFICEYFAQFQ